MEKRLFLYGINVDSNKFAIIQRVKGVVLVDPDPAEPPFTLCYKAMSSAKVAAYAVSLSLP